VKHNKLVTLPYTLCLLKQIARLDLAENPLESPDPRNVRRGVAHVLNYLGRYLAAETSKVLDFSGLGLDALPPDCTTISFHTLILARNSIPELSAVVSKLPTLTRLDVSSNPMSVFPSILKKASRLKTVALDDISFQELPPWIPQVRVSELSFCGNSLSVLPKELPSMATLTTLRLSRNAIEEIPPVLLECAQLEHLFVDANRIKALPENIHALRNLQTIDVSRNSLDALPASLYTMMSLTSISISHNKFRAIPAAIGDLKNLEHINIVSNSIRQLPYSMGNLANLKTIEFIDNPLSHPLEVFAQGAQATVAYLKTIQESQKSRVLKLEGAALGSFPEDALSIQGLVDLNMSDNVIVAIPASIAVCSAATLSVLRLSRNKLQFLPPEIAALTALATLDLSHNLLQTLPRQMAVLTNISDLLLGGNPWQGALSDYVEQGIPAVFAYLKKVQDAAVGGELNLSFCSIHGFPNECVAVTIRSPRCRRVCSLTSGPSWNSTWITITYAKFLPVLPA
jgi:Leucine-rich repeat (LRR) protein